MPRLLVLLALLAHALALPAAGKAHVLTSAKLQQIETLIRAEMKHQSIPGLTIAIGIGKDVRWSKGFGLADIENSVPATPATVYRLASISKPITATAIMQQVEQGKIELDAPIQEYVPAYPPHTPPITVRELLSHLSGLRHYQGKEIDSTRHYLRLSDALRIFENDPLLSEPGAEYHYTTYGFVLLGVALENVTGETYTSYVKRHVFDAAHMEQTQADNVYHLIPHRAHGYLKNSAGEIMNCALADTSNKIPGGGLSSTADDLIEFANALQRGKLVRKSTLEQMWTEQRTTAGRLVPYGLGWTIGEFSGLKRVGHTGAQQGTSTNLSLLPSEQISVAILCNLEGVQWPALLDAIEQALLAE